MNALGHFGFIALASLAIASCGSAPRIDGNSQAAFERSHAAVIAALSAEDRLRLSLAELIVLSPKGCLTTKSLAGQPFLNETLGGQADLSPCRKELHGLTFKDIMDLAYPQGEPVGGGVAGAA
ncbi:hypothetical protein [Luteimonas sp. A501]